MKELRAFTLIELLVVIAVISLLASILFPVFAQAREQARKTTCLSNTKQIGLSVLMYAQDYDETFPLLFVPTTADDRTAFQYVPGGISTLSWQNVIQPYAKNWGLMICPDDKFNKADPRYVDPFLNFGIPANSNVDGVTSFYDTYYSGGTPTAFNGIGGAFPDNGWSFFTLMGAPSLSLAAVNSAATMTLATDATAPDWWGATFGPGGNDTQFFGFCTTWFPAYGIEGFGPSPRHNTTNTDPCNYTREIPGMFNVVFTDGHSKSVQTMQYFRVKTVPGIGPVYANLWPSE